MNTKKYILLVSSRQITRLSFVFTISLILGALLVFTLSFHFPVRASPSTPTVFGSPAVIDVAASGLAPRVAVSSRDNAVAVFLDVDIGSGYHRVYARSYTAGVWSSTASVWDDGYGDSLHPDIALSSDGNGVAVFLTNNPGGLHVFANRLVNGHWQGYYQIDYGVTGIYNNPPRVALSSDGNGIAVFSTGKDVYAVRLAAGNWLTPQKLSGSQPTWSLFPTV